jgi:hypothetical protein
VKTVVFIRRKTMPLNKAQLEVLNELVIDPLLGGVVDEFRSKVSHKFHGESTLSWVIPPLFSYEEEEGVMGSLQMLNQDYGISETATNALLNLRNIYLGNIDIFKNHPLGEQPTLVDIRIAVLNITLDLLQQLPSWAAGHYRQPPLPEGLEGMAKIRALFKQYMSTRGECISLERVLLATQITVEKEKLGIPSMYPSHTNFAAMGFAPGDFSGLDFSKMSFHAYRPNDQETFEKLQLQNSNLEGSDFNGFDFAISRFDNSNLRGVLFRNCSFGGVSMKGANIEGMHRTGEFLADRRAQNFELVSRTLEDLMQFRREKLGMVEALDPRMISGSSMSSESASHSSSSSCSSLVSSSVASSSSSTSSSAASMSSSSSASSAAASQHQDELVDAVMRPQRTYLRARRQGAAGEAAAGERSAAAPAADNKGSAPSAGK